MQLHKPCYVAIFLQGMKIMKIVVAIIKVPFFVKHTQLDHWLLCIDLTLI